MKIKTPKLILFLIASLFILNACETAKEIEKKDDAAVLPGPAKKTDAVIKNEPALSPPISKEMEKENAGINKDFGLNYDGPYLFKEGDKMEISVLDEPEMTRDVFVLPDGSITYLLVGEISAAGKTAAELKEALSASLSEYFIGPKVSIIVKELKKEKLSSYVSVMGAVQRPDKVEIVSGEKLIDAVTKAGGLLYINDILGGRSVANLKASYLSRNGKKLDVDFYRLLRQGDMTQNVLLKPGDFIYFAESDVDNIIVLGEVENPTIIPYTRDISVVEAISRSGGFTDQAQKGKVIVLRNSGEDTEVMKIDLESVLLGKEKQKNLWLKAGDIIFVPEQGMSEYGRYADYLMTFGSLILQGYQVREQIRFPRLHRRDTDFF
jgi:polysaccharide export outer membrane protein